MDIAHEIIESGLFGPGSKPDQPDTPYPASPQPAPEPERYPVVDPDPLPDPGTEPLPNPEPLPPFPEPIPGAPPDVVV